MPPHRKLDRDLEHGRADAIARRRRPRPSDIAGRRQVAGAAVIERARRQPDDPAEAGERQAVLRREGARAQRNPIAAGPPRSRARSLTCASPSARVRSSIWSSHPRLGARRLGGTGACLQSLAAAEQELLAPLADRRLRDAVTARSLRLRALARRTDSTIFSLTSTGCLGGRATAGLLHRQEGLENAHARGWSHSQQHSPYGLARCLPDQPHGSRRSTYGCAENLDAGQERFHPHPARRLGLRRALSQQHRTHRSP